jgi:hypothetical protein
MHPIQLSNLNASFTLAFLQISCALGTDLLFRSPPINVSNRILVQVVFSTQKAVVLSSLADVLNRGLCTNNELVVTIGTFVLRLAEELCANVFDIP